jgi:flagellar protein FliS
MLYEGAIRFLEQSAAGFGCDDPLEFNQTVNNGVLRAQAIIDELNVILNMEAGGEISTNFRRLYDYLYRRLQAANVKKQKEPIEEVIMHLRVLRDSWAEMLQQTAARDEQAGKPEASLQTA